MRPVRILVAIFFIPSRLHHFHPRPIRIQLIRHNPRQRRPHAIPHLRPVRHNVSSPVRIDRHINARAKRRLIHRPSRIEPAHVTATTQPPPAHPPPQHNPPPPPPPLP